MSSTTKIYKANADINLDALNTKKNDLYQFGCEFEFYIDTTKYNFSKAVKNIKNEILTFCDVNILVDLTYLPDTKDKDHCVQIKPDQSLEDNGIEISIPITSQLGVIHYIKNILPLIKKYGYTNKDTGLHFHISTIKKDGANFNFYLYMLMCDDKKLLSSWEPRSGYSRNVMDILFKNEKSKARKVKNKKGTIWNLEKREANRIEIKSIGGIDYHKNMDKILKEFDIYVECFDNVFRDTNTEYREKLINEHKNFIKSINDIQQGEFSKAINESGLGPI